MENAGQERNMFDTFLDWSQTSIQSQLHAISLIGVLQSSSVNEYGVLAILGHENRTKWINENSSTFFSPDGLICYFCHIYADVFKQHLKKAENQTHAIYNRNHSNERGSDHEEIPDWTRALFQYFKALENSETLTQQALITWDTCNHVVSILTGRQAPLGPTGNDGPGELCNETSSSWRCTSTRKQVVGTVNC